MCGIAGIIGGPKESRERALSRLLERMVHRGPDDEGTFHEGETSLGMRRLSIIDLETGHQPIGNEDGTVLCVENGEIYNYLELREELRQRGHRFRTQSDAEVVVHLYEERGEACVEALRGMFALAVLDRPRRRLVLFRDRLGIKPLVYAEVPGGLIFASEIEAILASGWVTATPDPVGCEELLTLGSCVDPRTAFQGIRRLPPGHLLVWEDGRSRVARYWRPPAEAPRPVSASEAEDAFRTRLTESIRLRLRSDVPVGAFLSGGLDSSLLVALAAREHSGPLRTFTIRFPETPLDESQWAEQVARRYGTRHQVLPVEAEDAGTVMDELVRRFGEPFSDASAVPTWYLSRLAAREVKVVLGGDGGDELMAGYTRYQGERLARLWQRAPSALRAVARRVLRADPSEDPSDAGGVELRRSRMSAVYEASELDPAERFYRKSLLLPLRFWERLFHADWKARRAEATDGAENAALDRIRSILEESASMDWVGRLGALDLRFYLPQDMLFKVDAMSMAHSLEVRLPYLDHPLVEYSAGLPGALKLRGWERKHLLRRLARPLLPEGLADRRKQGFLPPLSRWFRGDLRTTARDRLRQEGGAVGRILDGERLARWLDTLEGDRRDLSARQAQALWSLLLLDSWARQYQIT